MTADAIVVKIILCHFFQRGYYIRGRNKSCGCYSSNRTHGLSYKTPLYSVWKGIKARCYNVHNKRYKNYGGRGITLCAEWHDFKKFYDWSLANGYKEGLTIDRIDNDGNYAPDNCRWADTMTQANNHSDNHFLTYNGETFTLAQWTRKLNFPLNLIWKRLQRGWSVEEALTLPVGSRRG